MTNITSSNVDIKEFTTVKYKRGLTKTPVDVLIVAAAETLYAHETKNYPEEILTSQQVQQKLSEIPKVINTPAYDLNEVQEYFTAIINKLQEYEQSRNRNYTSNQELAYTPEEVKNEQINFTPLASVETEVFLEEEDKKHNVTFESAPLKGFEDEAVIIHEKPEENTVEALIKPEGTITLLELAAILKNLENKTDEVIFRTKTKDYYVKYAHTENNKVVIVAS